MARVRSTARVEREGGEAEGSETIPISEAMQRSGLVTLEEIPTAETEQATAEAEEGNIEETDSEDDYRIAMPSKPSHLDFGKSTVSKADLSKMVKSGYFSESQKKLLRFGGEETTPKPEKDTPVRPYAMNWKWIFRRSCCCGIRRRRGRRSGESWLRIRDPPMYMTRSGSTG